MTLLSHSCSSLSLLEDPVRKSRFFVTFLSLSSDPALLSCSCQTGETGGEQEDGFLETSPPLPPAHGLIFTDTASSSHREATTQTVTHFYSSLTLHFKPIDHLSRQTLLLDCDRKEHLNPSSFSLLAAPLKE